ncbi:MAG: hypothetical protein BGO11_13050 [Solirubrobacterales bacterium 70-9]|nr:MAG: hypothetical protein BGO11_13050 [Solirubrobacterales bacterium 70-9]
MTPDLRAAVNGIGLGDEQIRTMRLSEPTPVAGATAGEPHESWHSAYIDGATEVGVWESTPGRWSGAKEGISEMMHLLSGRVTITDEDGTAHELGAGTMFILLDGWRGQWEVHETVRKVYAIWPTR